ncbi:MAG TPA: bifunctional diaminohydroxyphosphoribosylaminopyrimidine deaminase/5-amino-6-(5-phosphoribosylamino)uracil reductase RibD, partial [Nannocystaceae bacterium]|nr:bifunctional diaminohydroxyphosphoribosylaminopyrimidine deaminase/5-amino-6-(5-phosphoribosylamino)uracil reductase RibD [Nannocystaceae bacterium]
MKRRTGARVDDESAMLRAVAWARRGLGATYPNPCVGAVVVANGRIVAGAHSSAAGGPHAEVRALAKSGARARGATLVVTLEPCCHRGRTGPCTSAILAAGIRRVVVGIGDPAPHASGKGPRLLRKAGVAVVTGVAKAACAEVHAHYLHHVTTHRPWVTLKAAASLDGRLSVASGASKWITGEPARRDAHRLRAQHHAVAVGIGTVVADDPRLDVRLVKGVDPIVVVFDSTLRLGTPALAHAAVLRPGTLVLHGPRVSAARRARVRERGAEPLAIQLSPRGSIDVDAALALLGHRDIRSLLVEGGGRLLGSFVAAGAWQRFVLYQAPRLLGDG